MPDKHEVGGSSPLGPTSYTTKYNRLKFLWLPFFSKKVTGGDDGIRTHDPLLAGQVLSQLSYTPIIKWFVVVFLRFLD